MKYFLPWFAAFVIMVVLSYLQQPKPQTKIDPICPRHQHAVLVGAGIEQGTHNYLAAVACESDAEAKL